MLKYTTLLTLEKKKNARGHSVSHVWKISKRRVRVAQHDSSLWYCPLLNRWCEFILVFFLILEHHKLSLSEAVTGRKQQNTELLCLYVNVACMCYCVLKKICVCVCVTF